MVFREPEIGRIVTMAQAQAMPEWQLGSRFPFLPMPSLLSLFSRNFVVSYLPPALYGPWAWLLVALGLSALWCGPKNTSALPGRARFAAALGLPLGFSVLMFEVSRLLAFRLHIPDRNLKYTIPYLGLILMAVAMVGLVSWVLAKTRLPGWCGWAAALVITGSVLLGGSGFTGNLNLWADQRFAWKLYEFVERLPKDALLAGPPGEMDNIPLFSRRKVYISDEANQPLYDRYYVEVRRRLMLVFKAYYATDKQVVDEFSHETGVDYMLVRKEDFTHRFRRARYYSEPYNNYILSLKGDRPAGDFIFANPPRQAVIHDDGYFQVVELAKLR